MVTDSSDERFDIGLEIILRGLASYLPTARPEPGADRRGSAPPLSAQLFQLSSYGSCGVGTGLAELTSRYGMSPPLTGSFVRLGV